MNPPRFGSIAAARKITHQTTPQQHHSSYTPPPRPPRVSPEQQHANQIASEFPCPQGVAPRFRHLILIASGEGCAHCGTDSITIIDQHNRGATQ